MPEIPENLMIRGLIPDSGDTVDSLCTFRPIEKTYAFVNIQVTNDDRPQILLCLDSDKNFFIMKFSNPGGDGWALTVIEAECLKRLDHPHIPKFINLALVNRIPNAFETVEPVNLDKPIPVLMMEDLGHERIIRTLEYDLKLNRGPLPPSKILLYMAQIADALDYAESKGVYHLDLKPANILIAPDEEMAYLIDFNVAFFAGSNRFLSPQRLYNWIVGTPGYISPEGTHNSRADNVDYHKSQLYGFAVTIFELLTGEIPTGTDPDPMEVMKRTTMASVELILIDNIKELNEKQKAKLKRFFKKTLSKDPADRPKTAVRLIKAFKMAIS